MNSNNNNFLEKLKSILHDPVDKCFEIVTHEKRAEQYAEKIGISNLKESKGSDLIASCMERSLLPKEKKIYQKFNEIRHPLSEGKLEFTLSIDKDEIFSSIEEVFLNLDLLNYDDKRKFFYMWRNLEDEIFSVLKDKENHKIWLKYLPILPADTRIPDHSIWEHLKITSTLNAFWNEKDKILYQNNSLFLFTIGPVQSFISQARKTQDFYMGSFILSYLTFVAIKEIINHFGPTSIIYPDLYKQPLIDWLLEEDEKEQKIPLRNSYSPFVDLPTIPNRFVAIIPLTDESKLKEIAQKMKEKIQSEIKAAKERILNELNLTLTEYQKNIFDNHLSDFPQIYWVSVPWKIKNRDLAIDDLTNFIEKNEIDKWKEIFKFAQETGENPPNIGILYQLFYTVLEKFIGARKNLREFNYFEEKGRKCSLCGERNVLFYREEKNPQRFSRYNPIAINLKDIKEFPRKYLSDGEGLCGLCFFKRTFDAYLNTLAGKMNEKFKDFGFPSTAEIAASDFKERALKEAKEDMESYIKEMLNKKLPEGTPLPKLKESLTKNLEGEYFFEENLKKEFIKKELGLEISDEEIEKLKRCLKSIKDKIGNPNPYYAVIYLDGDNMGRWLSGELLPNIEYAYNSNTWVKLPEAFKKDLQQKIGKKFLTPAIHSAISRALKNYAIEFVRKIVEEEHLGKLVYAGGDDVFAFVNLKDLMDVIEKLRWAFSGHIKVKNNKINVDINQTSGFVLKEDIYYLTMGKNATCSMGIVIAHYKEPLKLVIDKVYKMKKKAKSQGKNRFAISLIKKSGEERVSVFEWIIKTNGKFELITDLMKGIKEMMNPDTKQYISHGFVQKFKMEFIKLKNNTEDSLGYLLCNEQIAKTELKRLAIRAYNGEKKKKKEFCIEFHDKVWKLFVASGMNIDNFSNIIEILSFINKGD
ncbi:MAG: type III-B CRISPR-associated protein Cas10/Cmr2 [candidate division WOR-3 bacterium]